MHGQQNIKKLKITLLSIPVKRKSKVLILHTNS